EEVLAEEVFHLVLERPPLAAVDVVLGPSVVGVVVPVGLAKRTLDAEGDVVRISSLALVVEIEVAGFLGREDALVAFQVAGEVVEDVAAGIQRWLPEAGTGVALVLGAVYQQRRVQIGAVVERVVQI